MIIQCPNLAYFALVVLTPQVAVAQRDIANLIHGSIFVQPSCSNLIFSNFRLQIVGDDITFAKSCPKRVENVVTPRAVRQHGDMVGPKGTVPAIGDDPTRRDP